MRFASFWNQFEIVPKKWYGAQYRFWYIFDFLLNFDFLLFILFFFFIVGSDVPNPQLLEQELADKLSSFRSAQTNTHENNQEKKKEQNEKFDSRRSEASAFAPAPKRQRKSN